MSACCGDDHIDGDDDRAETAETLVQVSEIRWAAAAGVILLASFIAGWNDLHRAADVLAVVAAGVGGRTFVPGTLRSLRRGKIGVGTLMTIAGLGALALGEFHEAAMLAFLFSISEGLEEFSVGQAQRGLRALLTLLPETAIVRRDGIEQGVPSVTIRIGETLIVRPGGRIATDGTIQAGHSTVDMAAITGESMPVEVQAGSLVFAGSINANGALEVEATATTADNSLARVVDLVTDAQAYKGQRQRLADRIARPLVPGVMAVASIIAILGSLLGDPHIWIQRALVVLVAASPCALAISVPISLPSMSYDLISNLPDDDFNHGFRLYFNATERSEPASLVTTVMRRPDITYEDTCAALAGSVRILFPIKVPSVKYGRNCFLNLAHCFNALENSG